jgi:hypothetical protein
MAATGKLTQKQMEVLSEVRKKAINMLLACEEFEEGKIDAEDWESRITKKGGGGSGG